MILPPLFSPWMRTDEGKIESDAVTAAGPPPLQFKIKIKIKERDWVRSVGVDIYWWWTRWTGVSRVKCCHTGVFMEYTCVGGNKMKHRHRPFDSFMRSLKETTRLQSQSIKMQEKKLLIHHFIRHLSIADFFIGIREEATTQLIPVRKKEATSFLPFFEWIIMAGDPSHRSTVYTYRASSDKVWRAICSRLVVWTPRMRWWWTFLFPPLVGKA